MFRIKIDTDNSAFQQGLLTHEISQIVQRAITRMNAGDRNGIARDSNGNAVGNWILDHKDEEVEGDDTADFPDPGAAAVRDLLA